MTPEFDADVIVVGAGILGALAAERLAAKGKSVLMLEAGPRVSRGKLLETFRNSPDHGSMSMFPDLASAPKSSGGHYSDDYIETTGAIAFKPSYLRVVGGTTWHWSSAFWRFLPNDFKLHSLYGQGRDWPIDYDELEPWYTLAEQITGCSGSDSDDQSGRGGKPFPRRSAPYPMPAGPWSSYTRAVADRINSLGLHFVDEPNLRATRVHDGRPPCMGNNNCSPLCPIGAQFTGDMAVARAERAGAKVLPETVASRIEKGPGGRIVAIHTLARDGRSTRRTARYFVLAAHAIETPKLMLISEVGNSSGQVGRNLMSHPSLFYQVLADEPLWPGRGPVQQGGVNDWRDGAHRARHAAFKYHSNNQVPNTQVTERLLQQGVIGRELDERIRYDAARYVSMVAGMEQLPLPTNRVTLSSRRDALGLPTPSIHFDIDDYVRRAAPVASRDFARFDQVFKTKESLGDRKVWRMAAHPTGTTIMGSDKQTSVVDADCRSHDHANLFIASTGNFPSSCVVNPTLTGAALALRMAEKIGREI